MKDPLVSIIILNWNGEKHIHRCAEFVKGQSYKNIEVVVVDNASTDGSTEKLKKKYKAAFTFIDNDKNEGFAKGMNIGFESTSGKYVIPLNQDVCLDKDFVKVCVKRLEEDEEYGVIGGRVYSWVGDELVNEIRPGEGEKYFMRKRFQGYGGIFSEVETEVFAPTGSFPFMRREMLEDVKASSGDFYDEMFETGWEDLDLWFRMQLRGWKCIFMPTAFGWHVSSGSVGGKSTLLTKPFDYQIRILRNRYFTILKGLPISVLLWLSPYLLFTEAALLPYFLLKAPRVTLAWFTAMWRVLKAMPVIIRKRRRIQTSRKVPASYLKQFFVRF